MNDNLDLEPEDTQEEVLTVADYAALQVDTYPDSGPYPDLQAAQHVAYAPSGIKTIYATPEGFYIRDWRHLGTWPKNVQIMGRFAFGRWQEAVISQT